MNFKESDIKLDSMHWKQFEELCFDLLQKYQFHSLIWRQGGGDKGRDIEGIYSVTNSLVGSYPEKWYFECKHYSKGVPPEQIATKILWAVAGKVQHFVLMTNKYPTVPATEYMKERQGQVEFKIHVIDGKHLKQRLLQFPDLVVKYFADDTTVLIQGFVKQWLSHDILPDLKTLYKLSKLVDVRTLSLEEIVFLFFAFESSDYDDTTVDNDDDIEEEFSFDFLIPVMTAQAGNTFPIKEVDAAFKGRNMYWFGGGNESTRSTETDYFVWHYLGNFTKDKLLDIYLERDQKLFKVIVSTCSRSKLKNRLGPTFIDPKR
jgi:hypothetical protein